MMYSACTGFWSVKLRTKTCGTCIFNMVRANSIVATSDTVVSLRSQHSYFGPLQLPFGHLPSQDEMRCCSRTHQSSQKRYTNLHPWLGRLLAEDWEHRILGTAPPVAHAHFIDIVRWYSGRKNSCWFEHRMALH